MVISLRSDPRAQERFRDDLKTFCYLVFLDPPFEDLWDRISTHPPNNHESTEANRSELLGQWLEYRSTYQDCHLQLSTRGADVNHIAKLIIHCFYT